MASEPDHRCPICLDTMDDASYAMPCLHRFCFGCIRRWTQSRPTCPLCNRRLRSILHSVRADNSFEEFVVRRPGRARRAPQRQRGAVPTWASMFCHHPSVLRPLLPWLHQKLRQLFQADNMAASAVWCLVISGLHFCHLDEGALIWWLLSFLQSQATSFM